MLQPMSGRGAFYDDDEWRATYLQGRERPDNPHDAIERPIFRELAGDLSGLDIIDLGCGDARFGREALEEGAHSYLGVEISEQMAILAQKNLEGLNGRIIHGSIEGWRARPREADLVTSCLALNHVEDLGNVFMQVRTALRTDGRMILSVEHPIITSNYRNLEAGRRTSWLVDDYFLTGARPHRWVGREVVKYHRTLEDYLDLLQGSGLQLVTLRESRPLRENFQSEEEYRRRLRIPLFLFIVARP
jgi:SAM-dependent methyltransferase